MQPGVDVVDARLRGSERFSVRRRLPDAVLDRCSFLPLLVELAGELPQRARDRVGLVLELTDDANAAAVQVVLADVRGRPRDVAESEDELDTSSGVEGLRGVHGDLVATDAAQREGPRADG